MRDKKEIRRLVRAAKAGCTEAELRVLSAAAVSALEAHPRFRAATTVLLYHSLPDEVFTHVLLEKYREAKRILLPVVDGERLRLRAYRGAEHIAAGSYSIGEPEGEDFLRYGEIELAVVPGMAFDADGHRVGRGKGYYDRLLASPALSALYKIGICFPFQLFPQVPAEAFDVSMDEVICGA